MEVTNGAPASSILHGRRNHAETLAKFSMTYGSVEEIDVVFLSGAFRINGQQVSVKPFTFKYQEQSAVEFNQMCG